MTTPRWSALFPPDELGAVVHGPIILAGSTTLGVVAGLRCVFAHPAGLHLPVVLAASGIHAEAAARCTHPTGWGGGVGGDPLRPLRVTVEINNQRDSVEPYRTQSGSNDHYDLTAAYWIPELPGDGRVRLTTSWPEIGLPEHTVELTCPHLNDLAARVLPLR